VHVLRKVHEWLRPDGLLLDLHPEPEFLNVDVVRPRLGSVRIGQIDTTSLISNIHAARATLASLVEAGWFEPQRAVLFDFILVFRSVDQWLRHREERRASSFLDPRIVDHARELLSAADGEVRVTERVLATRLIRLARTVN
jgi:hypothetical protein